MLPLADRAVIAPQMEHSRPSMDEDAAPDPAAYRPSWLYRLMLAAVLPAMLHTWAQLCIEGLENLPATGPYIIVANHVDNTDSYAIGLRLHRTLHFLARPAGMQSRWLGRFWRLMAAIPADREGLRLALTMLKAGEVIGVYPDGVITPRLLQAKAGVGALAARAAVPVVPVAVWGTERLRLWPWPRGRRRPLHVRYGTPRSFSRGDVRRLGLQGIADEVMTDVAALLPPAYRGYYAAAAAARAAGQPLLPEHGRRSRNGTAKLAGQPHDEQRAAESDRTLF
ncbi:MAG TPA: lysophospholipid acyltransferase family protein [Dehalococcoidia bacterium]|nr:lysophospholipid acyltransferase family protein [Dehalococcoidia bacterium]